MFKIYKGGDTFFQWDIGQRLLVEDPEMDKVHFCNKTKECSLVCDVYEDEESGLRLVNVPNILLQDTFTIRAFGCLVESEDSYFAKGVQVFKVIARTKPEDYVYTEEELKNWATMEEKIDSLEAQLEEIEERIEEAGTGAGGCYIPVKGVDYFTEEDKNELVSLIVETLGGQPVSGYVDENNNIIITAPLAEGTYTAKYEISDGTFITIGNLVLGDDPSEPEEPKYKNWLPLAVDINGNDFVGTHANGGDGYECNQRISGSNGNQTAAAGAYCSGFIPLSDWNDEIYIKGITLYQGNDTYNNIVLYDESKTRFWNGAFNVEGYAYAKLEGDTWHFLVNQMTQKNPSFFRFSCGGITDETIVTVNEKIE